jgi:DNA polymerase I
VAEGETLIIEGALLDVDYVNINGDSVIRMAVRSSDGKAYAIFDPQFRPYFYFVPAKEGVDFSSVTASDNGKIITPAKIEKEGRLLFGKRADTVKITVSNASYVPKLSDALVQLGSTYESDIPFAKRYVIDKNITPLALHKIRARMEKGILVLESLERTDQKTPMEFNTMCFDIEVYSPVGMPSPDKHPIIMISYIATRNGTERRSVLTFKKIDLPFVEVVPDEKAMIRRFVDLVRELDVDIITGYNSSGFDVKYLLERSKVLGIDFNLSRFEGSTKIERHGLVDRVKIGGMVHVDMYVVVKFISVVGASESILKLNSKTLKNVYEAITNEKKFAVEKTDIHKLWMGSKEELETLAQYNMADSEALKKVYDTFMPIMTNLSMLTYDPLTDVCVSTTGQLVEFMMMHDAHNRGELIPNKPSEGESRERSRNPIEGAYVKTPDPGIYNNLAMFDFRGLYPSIIISYNIDPSTVCSGCTDYYESPDGTRFDRSRPGVMPLMLKMMIEQRAEVKKAYKKNPNDIVLGSKSMALKIVSNSAYGYLGYARSRWYSRACAASVTAFGRQYIKEVMARAEERGMKVIYGDSVDGDSVVRIREGKNGARSYRRIGSLFTRAEETNDQGKEYQYTKDIYVETLDERGRAAFKKVKYIMRHKSKKRMYRVWLTNATYIDVTEDHSLIGYAGLSKMPNRNVSDWFVEVKPTRIGKDVNTLIVKKVSAKGRIQSRHYTRELYELMGFFIGDGSFDYGRYKGKRTKRYYIGLAGGDDKKELHEKLLMPLKEMGMIRNIIDRGRGDFVINGLELVRLFEKELLQDGKKRLPDFIFKETRENICSFVRGLFSSDGTIIFRNGKPIIRYTTVDSVLASQIRMLLWECGIASSVFKENKENQYKGKGSGTYSHHVFVKSNMVFIRDVKFLFDRKNARISDYRETSMVKKNITRSEFDTSMVQKVEQIQHNGYVYDMEVEGVHRFFAGGVLVHNTDSIALLLGDKTKEEALEFVKAYNSKLPKSMELELEDFYKRGVFVGKRTGEGGEGAKKKYALISDSGRIKIKGFELVRRDWSRIARDTQRAVLEMILKEGDAKKASEIVKDAVRRLKEGRVPLSELVISTQLRKGLDGYDINSPEVAAARKAVKSGAKTKEEVEGGVIGYVITRHGSSISDKAELEEVARDYDPDYYINRQIIPATMKIIKELGFSEEELKGLGTQKRLGG